MSQDLYKTRTIHWKGNTRQSPEARQHEARTRFVNENFRHLSLTEDDSVDSNDFNEEPIVQQENPPARDSLASLDASEDDWSDPTPAVDLRDYNYDLPGLLCPFCKKDVMNQNLESGQLVCGSCQTTVQTILPVDLIKTEIKKYVDHHRGCPSGRSPDYTMFKDDIVLTCHHCRLWIAVNRND